MSLGKTVLVLSSVILSAGLAQAQGLPSYPSYCTTAQPLPSDWGRNPNMPDVNGRPTMAPACGMPAEYDCPLFDKRPHEGLNQAIDSLMSVLAVTPECKDIGGSSTMVAENATALRDAVIRLQQILQQTQGTPPQGGVGGLPGTPAMPGTPPDPAEIQRQMAIAVNAGNILGQIFSNNALLNSRCGKAISGTGETLLAINDLLNSLSPLALAASAFAPGIGTAAQFAITGGSLATGAIANVVNLVNQGKLDMNNPQIRRAVLKNTCLFTKIARKAHFMQLAASNQIQVLNQELERERKKPVESFETSNPEMKKDIEYRESVEQQASVVELQRKKDGFELSALEMESRAYEGDELTLCLRAQELVRLSAAFDQNYTGPYSRAQLIFPMSLIINLNTALCLTNTSQNGSTIPVDVYQCQSGYNTGVGSSFPPIGGIPQDPTQPPPSESGSPERDILIKSLRATNGISRQRLSALEPKVLDNDPNAIRYCATIAKTWIKALRQIHGVTGQIINGERARLEDTLRQDPAYATWLERSQAAKAEEQTISRVARVMKELAKDNSVIDRSELDQRMSLLQGALFGYRGTWLSHSPIDQWLTHTLKLHTTRVASFNENIRQLQIGSGRLRVGGAAQFAGTTGTGVLRYAGYDDNLDAMTIDKVVPGTRGHEVACQLLKTTWLDWSASVDHLGASSFMCDMIDEYIDNKVQSGIAQFCRGEIGFDSRQLRPSRIQLAHHALVNPVANGGKSARDWAILVSKKVQDLKCPMPPVSVMN